MKTTTSKAMSLKGNIKNLAKEISLRFNEKKIQIISLQDDGDITFAVYGYVTDLSLKPVACDGSMIIGK